MAVGGASYALSAGLPTSSVPCCTHRNGATFLRLDSVRGGNIVNGQVMSADIGTDQVRWSDIRDGSIKLDDLTATTPSTSP